MYNKISNSFFFQPFAIDVRIAGFLYCSVGLYLYTVAIHLQNFVSTTRGGMSTGRLQLDQFFFYKTRNLGLGFADG